VERHTFANERMKRLIELRWFHGISFNGFLLATARRSAPLRKRAGYTEIGKDERERKI
jgi:hypothetical protein